MVLYVHRDKSSPLLGTGLLGSSFLGLNLTQQKRKGLTLFLFLHD